MNSSIHLLLLCSVVVVFHCGQCASESSCQADRGGVCQDASYYCSQGYEWNRCPGADNIKCCLPDVSSKCSKSERGVCQNTALPCDNPYISGLCPGSYLYKCCPPDTTTVCYKEYEGSCRYVSNGCAGGYASGLCPGPSNIRCCMNHERISHADAMTLLTSASINVLSRGKCSDRNHQNCTSLYHIRRVSVICLIKFKQASGCNDVTVSGGTEMGYESMSSTYSHWNGWMIAINSTPCVDSYITEKYRSASTDSCGHAVYRDRLGFLWTKKNNQWDIRFHE